MPTTSYDYMIDTGIDSTYHFDKGAQQIEYIYTDSTNRITVPAVVSDLNIPVTVHSEWIRRSSEWADKLERAFTIPPNVSAFVISYFITADLITLSTMLDGGSISVAFNGTNGKIKWSAFVAASLTLEEWRGYIAFNRHVANLADILGNLS